MTFPIAVMTLRQFSGGKAIRVVGLFSAVPVIFALIALIEGSTSSGREIFDGIFRDLIVPTMLPLATVIMATNALGNEIEDRTMVYLVLKPVSRVRIVLEKFAAVVQTTWLALVVGLILVWALSSQGEILNDLDLLATAILAVLVGVIAYGALFMALSLLIARALLAGIIYILIWETTLARIIPGAKVLSIQHYVNSIYSRLLSDPLIRISDALQIYSAMAAVTVLVVVALLFSVVRLRSMDLE
jgi:ABC-2 type transport system permease protein